MTGNRERVARACFVTGALLALARRLGLL